jgi:hypothetical protein
LNSRCIKHTKGAVDILSVISTDYGNFGFIRHDSERRKIMQPLLKKSAAQSIEVSIPGDAGSL